MKWDYGHNARVCVCDNTVFTARSQEEALAMIHANSASRGDLS